MGIIRRNPIESALAVLAALTFLGCLGAPELWGKREQRLAAEALDTVESGRWLVAQIQGRPRLEKPPLPRWTVAGLMTLSGAPSETLVRLPGALAALGMVGLVYGLGRRMGGRAVGQAAGLILASLFFFIVELRQGGNDGPLAFFTTLAIYAAWRRLHREAGAEGAGARGWALLFHTALGLGFLTKGPVALLLVALALGPYLVWSGTRRTGLRRLADPCGVALLAMLVLAWPIAVLVRDPEAGRVWLLEMGQKAGLAGLGRHRRHAPLVLEWFAMTLPWSILATCAVLGPVRRWRVHREAPSGGIVLCWSWAVASLAMFSTWRVAKPSYYVPCLPAVALLCGFEWVALCRRAREAGREGCRARWIVGTQWAASLLAAAILPVVAGQLRPELRAWGLVAGLALAGGVAAGAISWRRGLVVEPLVPVVAGITVLTLVVYGVVAPAENPARGHRELAGQLERLVPAGSGDLLFFRELDEGLWFYLRDRRLEPVPGTQPRYNDSDELVQAARRQGGKLQQSDITRHYESLLGRWLERESDRERYVLFLEKHFRRFAPALAGRAEVVYREPQRAREGIVLVRVDPARSAIAAQPEAGRAERR